MFFLVQHPYKNYFSNIGSNISPLLIINSLNMEIDKNYLKEVNDALIKNNLNNLKVYIKDHPMSKISINDLKNCSQINML